MALKLDLFCWDDFVSDIVAIDVPPPAIRQPIPDGSFAVSGVRACHWLMPGVICGCTPSHLDNEQLAALLAAGVRCFVSVQSSYIEYMEEFPEKNYAERIKSGQVKHSGEMLRFLNVPVDDFGTLKGADAVKLMRTLSLETRTIYVHCYGGGYVSCTHL